MGLKGFGSLVARLVRRHPDVYKVLKNYCDKQGYKMEDVVAAALSTYLSADEESRKELEQAFAERAEMIRAKTSPTAALKSLTETLQSVAELFKALNEFRSAVSIQSLASEYKAFVSAAKEIASEATTSSSGSIDQLIASFFLSRLFGMPPREIEQRLSSMRKKRTGTAPVETIGFKEEEE